MARLPRVHLDGAVYLVTCRGRSAALFQDAQDYETYLGLLRMYQARYEFRLFAYCLLADEVVLCVEPAAGSTLSAVMHDITAGYTRYVNRRHQRTGPLFQDRFHAAVAEKATMLLPLTAYVHRLPLRAGHAQALESYLHSSFSSYCASAQADDDAPMLREITDALALLPTDHTVGAYLRYVADLTPEDDQRLELQLRRKILGSDAFIERVQQQRARVPQAPPVAAVVEPPAVRRAFATAWRVNSTIPLLSAALCLLLMPIGLFAMSLVDRLRAMEQSIVALSQENEATFRARYSLAVQETGPEEVVGLDETRWEIRMMPMNATDRSQVRQDELAFTKNQVSSMTLANEGFQASRYTVTSHPNGGVLWETMQTSPQGDVVCWRGERHGTTMQGVVTRQPIGKAVENFTFVGVTRESPGSSTRSKT